MLLTSQKSKAFKKVTSNMICFFFKAFLKINEFILCSGVMELVVEDHLEQTGGIGRTDE